MSQPHFISTLCSLIPESDQPWVIAAMRQDSIVWDCLQFPAFLDKLQANRTALTNSALEVWSPAALALVTLDQPASMLGELRQSLPVDTSGIVQKVAHTNLEGESQDPKVRLGQAALLAIALHKRRLDGTSWDCIASELRDKPLVRYGTLLACLYGMIPDPLEMLRAFIYPGAPINLIAASLHAFLSNPIPPPEQVNTLWDILTGQLVPLPPGERILVLRAIASQRRILAQDISDRWLTTYPYQAASPDWNTIDIFTHLRDIEELIFQSEIQYLSGASAEALSFQCAANEGVNALHAGLRDREAQLTCLLDPSAGLFSSRNNASTQAQLSDEHISLTTSIADLVQTAKSAHEGKDLQTAESAARKALQLIEYKTTDVSRLFIAESIPYTLLNELGSILICLELFHEAESVARIGLSLRPTEPDLMILLAKALSGTQHTFEARQAIELAVTLEPTRSDFRRSLAHSLEDTGDWTAALKQRSYLAEIQSSSQSPDSQDDLRAFACCAIHAGNPEQAISACQQLIQINSEDGIAHYYFGEALSSQGDLDRAIPYLVKATQLIYLNPLPWLALANAQNRLDLPDRALETLQTAVQTIPNEPKLFLSLGQLYLAKNALTQALSSFQRGAELAPDNTKIALLLGRVSHQLGHTAAARRVLEAAYQQTPQDIELAHAYTQVLLALGDIKAAVVPFEAYLESGQINDPKPYLEYTRLILTVTDDNDQQPVTSKAVQIAQRALDIAPNNYEAFGLYAEVLAASGDLPASLSAFQSALDTPLVEEPGWISRLSYGLGRAAISVGDTNTAIAALQEAVQDDPNNPKISQALAEAYLRANLQDNALLAAHTALNMAMNDLNNLTWFADFIKQLYYSYQNSQALSEEPAKQMLGEGINTLTLALQIAPDRSNLLIKLGEMQLLVGDESRAREAFHKVISCPNSTSQDLKNAGSNLLQLGETASSIQCLERAISLEEQTSGSPPQIWLEELAQAYQEIGDYSAALRIVDVAIARAPDIVRLCQWKAQLLLKSDQAENALSCLEEVLQHTSAHRNQVDLYYMAAYINRSIGNLLRALEYAEIAIGLIQQSPELDRSDPPDHLLDVFILTAGLRRTLLQPEQAYRLLTDNTAIQAQHSAELDSQVEYLCLKSELSLDFDEEPDLDSASLASLTTESQYPRWQALNARLEIRQGSHPAALDTFQSALANYRALGTNLDHQPQNWYPSCSDCLALVEVALELGQWDVAVELAKKARDTAPFAPLVQLTLARVYVLRGEFQDLCDSTQVVTHAPGYAVLSNAIQEACDNSIRASRQQVERWAENRSDCIPQSGNLLITRWQARSDAIFTNGAHLADATVRLSKYIATNKNLPFYSNSSDVSALIAACRRQSRQAQDKSILSLAMQSAELYPHDPFVLSQITLLLAKSNPQEAIKALQTAIHSLEDQGWLPAISQALLALVSYQNGDKRLATEAIERALNIWPDEPRWHSLAAEIYSEDGDIQQSVTHLEEAVKEEPQHVPHHLALGQAYLLYAETDAIYQKKSIRAYERACHLAPQNPDVWLAQARACMKINELEQATQSLDQVILLSPDNFQALLLRAQIALQQANIEEAYAYAQKATQIDPKDVSALLILAQTLEALGKPADAIQMLEHTQTLSDNPLPLQIKRAELLFKLQGAKGALDDLKVLAEHNPENLGISTTLAQTFADCGENEMAIMTAQRVLQAGEGELSHQSLADLHFLIGRLMRQAGQLDQAIHHLSKTIHYAPQLLEPYLELGLARKERREYQQALHVFQQATMIATDDPRPFYQAGLTLKEGKDYLRSEVMLRRAASLSPNDVIIRRQLASVVALNLVHNPRTGRMVGE
jgi:tetratricopeptide (TPR) repeat protein